MEKEKAPETAWKAMGHILEVYPDLLQFRITKAPSFLRNMAYSVVAMSVVAAVYLSTEDTALAFVLIVIFIAGRLFLPIFANPLASHEPLFVFNRDTRQVRVPAKSILTYEPAQVKAFQIRELSPVDDSKHTIQLHVVTEIDGEDPAPWLIIASDQSEDLPLIHHLGKTLSELTLIPLEEKKD